MFKSKHEESQILTWETGCLFTVRFELCQGGGGGRSQLEHLSVLGLDQNINKLSLDQRIGQMSRDMQRSQRTDRHMSGLKRQKVGQRDTAQYVFFLFLSSAGWMVFLSFVQK